PWTASVRLRTCRSYTRARGGTWIAESSTVAGRRSTTCTLTVNAESRAEAGPAKAMARANARGRCGRMTGLTAACTCNCWACVKADAGTGPEVTPCALDRAGVTQSVSWGRRLAV